MKLVGYVKVDLLQIDGPEIEPLQSAASFRGGGLRVFSHVATVELDAHKAFIVITQVRPGGGFEWIAIRPKTCTHRSSIRPLCAKLRNLSVEKSLDRKQVRMLCHKKR